MKNSLIIPVLNEAKNLPSLLKAISYLKGNFELIFVDNGSTDESMKLLKAFTKKQKNARLQQEKKQGFPEPLIAGIKKAKGENLFFLDADAIPDKNWLLAMEAALEKSPIVVGQTNNYIEGTATTYGKLSLALFADYGRKSALAINHSFPWGPACNLGVKKICFKTVGPFSRAAASAFDIDWCWRAVLSGLKIGYEPDAKINHKRRNSAHSLKGQMFRYGQGEVWLQDHYSFLTEENLALMERAEIAYKRVKAHPAAKEKHLSAALEECALAYALGVYAGASTKNKKCSLLRKNPKGPISWQGEAGIIIFMPGKGIVELPKESESLWHIFENGGGSKKIAQYMEKHFHMSREEAQHEAEHFVEAFT